jgi:hypothetical protein
MEDNQKENGRRPKRKWKITKKKMEDDQKENGRRPTKIRKPNKKT